MEAVLKMPTAVLVLGLVLLVNFSLAAPFPHKLAEPEGYNYTSSYIQFFNVQELIDKINIRKFKDQHQLPEQTEVTGSTVDVVTTEDTTVDVTNGVDTVEIDLTDEAIINDKVTNIKPAETIETVTDAPETTIGSLDEEAVDEVEETSEDDVEPTVSEVPSIGDSAEEDVALNTIDTDTFIVSGETVESAQKYGYKILLKKVGEDEVEVGKIKFSFPTTVEINPGDESSQVTSESEETTISNEEVSPKVVNEVEVTTVEEKVVEEVTTITAEVTTLAPTAAEEIIENESVDPKIVNIETTTIQEITAPSLVYLPPPVTAVLPTIDVIDEETIIEGVMQVKEDTEIAVAEIQSHDETDSVIVFPTCNVSVSEIEEILSNLATRVSDSAPILADILSTGQELRLESDTGTLARGGARLLHLLEPFLDSLLPAIQVSSCAGASSTTMLMSLSGMASQLETIATNEVDDEKADQLHSSATSLQLAAWVMAQLQASIHTFYDPEGLCEEGKSSTIEILGALSKAISGYIPVIGIMGNEVALEQLRETVTKLDSAKDEIARLLTRSELSSLPGVECGANFSTLGEQLDILADFLQAIPPENDLQ